MRLILLATCPALGTGQHENAVDGDPGTRWASEFSDPEWIYVDLGESVEIGAVLLNWECENEPNDTVIDLYCKKMQCCNIICIFRVVNLSFSARPFINALSAF